MILQAKITDANEEQDLHDYAFDGVTHQLFHPHGSDSLRNPQDEEIMKQVAFDDSLQSESLSSHSVRVVLNSYRSSHTTLYPAITQDYRSSPFYIREATADPSSG